MGVGPYPKEGEQNAEANVEPQAEVEEAPATVARREVPQIMVQEVEQQESAPVAVQEEAQANSAQEDS